MSDIAPNKIRCGHAWRTCWTGPESLLLLAPDPFNEGYYLVACPNCRNVDNLKRACDIDGCWQEATCGTPVPDARRYVSICGDHYRELSASTATP